MPGMLIEIDCIAYKPQATKYAGKGRSGSRKRTRKASR